MQDLEIAKKCLKEKNLTLSIVKNKETIFETKSHGISGFLEAIELLGNKLEGASVADRIAGKAIALLCAYVKVKAAYAVTMSKKAKNVFEQHSIFHEWTNLVESILDINKMKTCPFERLAREISNPKDAYIKLKALQNSLKNAGRKPHEQ